MYNINNIYKYFRIAIGTILLMSLLSVSVCNAIPFELWNKTFGGNNYDSARSIQQTTDGGYIIVGNTNSYGAGDSDVYMIKTNTSGGKLWSKIFGGSNWDGGRSVQQTTDGGYIIVGTTNSYGAGDSDVYMIKTNASGGKLWSKIFGGDDNDYGYSVQQTKDGGYIISGYTYSYGTGSIYLIKTNASGGKGWNKTFGGSGCDEGSSVQQTLDGGYIIVGCTNSYGAGNTDVYLIKTNNLGNESWHNTFGGSGWDWGSSVQQTTDGGYIITGGTSSYGDGSTDVYLIKTNVSGGKVWNKTFGGSNWDGGWSVQQTTDGGYIITGGTSSYGAGSTDVYLIKTNVSGGKVWNKTFGGGNFDMGLSVRQTVDRGYIIVGYTDSYGVGRDVWLIKVSAETPIRPNTLIINVQNATTGKPLKGATMRISYSGKYGIVLANTSNKTSTSNKEGMTNIFFKHKEGDIYVYIHIIRASAPWSSCTLYKDDSNINNKVWECKLSITGPQIMATKNTLSDRSDGGPAYARLGWTKIKNDPICTRTAGTTYYQCFTDKNFTTMAKDFHNKNPTVFKPFKIEKYVKTQSSDYDVLGYLKEGAIRFSINNIPIPLPVLTAIMSQETGCRWKDRNSCSGSQWRYDSYLGQYRTLVTFDGGIGAMQLTGSTALYGAELLSVKPDTGIGNLSGSFRNNIIAGAGILNSKDNVITDRNNTASWGTAIWKYNGNIAYLALVKARVIPFYPVSGKYIEDNSLFSHNNTYITLGTIWGKRCKINNDGLWECS